LLAGSLIRAGPAPRYCEISPFPNERLSARETLSDFLSPVRLGPAAFQKERRFQPLLLESTIINDFRI
jgi:hypothetical protein